MRDPRTVAVILGDDAPMLEAAVPTRVFGADVRSPGAAPFDVRVVSETPGPVTTSAGVRLTAPYALPAVADAGIVIVPGWRPPGGAPTGERVVSALQKAHAEGAIVVGLCLGAFVLAEAGLLQGLRATTHWHFTAELAASYPEVTVDGDVLYVDEGQILTSAGSAAGIDACLHLLRRLDGARAASEVARALVVAPHRNGGQQQFIEHAVPSPRADGGFGRTLERALVQLGDPVLDVDTMAGWALMSRRTFDRRFREATGCSALQWLLGQRVLHAQRLLEDSDLGVDAVAQRVGFADGVALRPHFRRVVGVAPQSYRESFRTIDQVSASRPHPGPPVGTSRLRRREGLA